LAKIFLGVRISRNFFKGGKVSGMIRRRIQLTDREWKWLWEYTRTGSNASQAARVVYGGTPISVRVKGHKKKVKLKPILDRIDKIWDQFLVRKPDGHLFLGKKTEQIEREMDTYLKRLKRRIRKSL
jgi:hypothetical protein